MRFLRHLARFLCLLSAALATSCIDGREEFWIDANGAGRAEIRYSLPATMARLHGGPDGIRTMIRDFLDDTPGLVSSRCDVTLENQRVHIHVSASLESAESFEAFNASIVARKLPSAASHLAGEVTTDLRGRTLEFNRKVSAARAMPGSQLLPPSRFKNNRLEYIVHLPVQATTSNASRTENNGHTLVWEIPLTEALKSPVTMHFTARMPIPWQRAATFALLLITAATGLALLSWKSRKPTRIGRDRSPSGPRE